MKTLGNYFKAVLVATLGLAIGLAHGAAIDVSTPKIAIPPNVVTTANRPMMMLAATKDHSLFGPIYTDFEDLDGDGVIDTTFKPTFKYYGYFDPTKCYSYSTTNSQFEPAATATVTGGRYTCSSGQSYWSGNFLNWSSMTRLDVVRKMLYGGKRSTDSTTTATSSVAATGTTVLERAQLTFDAHAFVKYYRGTDIRDYTPFTTANLTKTTGANANVYAGLSICNLGSADSYTSTSNAPIMRMVKGNVRFWSTVEVQLCQWRENYSSGTFGPKLARYYQDADKGAGTVAHEITIPSKSTDGATYGSTIGPELTVRVKVCDPAYLGEERCQAFPANSTTNYKPYGLFQEFGYSATGGAARAEFGVITGSYDKNYTAGALRKNMGDFADEINPNTGVFCHSANSGCSTTLASPDGRATGVGAIKAFDAIVLYGRSSGGYGSSGTPNGQGGTSTVAEGSLPAWGNPIGEMLVQALQYYAYNGTSPSPTNPSSTTKDTSVGAPVTAWQDPLSNANTTRNSLYGNSVCRPLNILLMSNSALSFDGQAATPFATLPNAPSIDAYTNSVGVGEGLNDPTKALRSVGSVTGGYGTSCSAKTITTLGQVSGICPEAPAMGGTYQVAGAALYGNTNKIRTISNPPSDLATTKDALKVKTLAASLTGGAPRIDIPVPGTTAPNVRYVYITPESVQNGGAISAPLTFASISSSSTHGAFIVTWNDVLMGGDYDMDITGFIRYDLVDSAGASNVNGPYIKVTTDIPGVCGGAAGTHGFSIIGVTDDTGASKNGRYLTHQHSGGGGSTFATLSGMPATSEYLCGDSSYRARNITVGGTNTTYQNTVCAVTGNGSTGDPGIPTLANYCTVQNKDFPVSMTFKMVGESDALLKDPLYYAAKYGDFDSSTENTDKTYTDLSMPPNQASWDKVDANGTAGPDGVPDGYFLARRPDLLEQQLRRALESLARDANTASATDARSLTSGSLVYEAKFDATTISGTVAAYAIDKDGKQSDVATWEAGQLLQTLAQSTVANGGAGNSRHIITNYGNPTTSAAAVPFRWSQLPTGYKTQMTTASTNHLTDTNASIVVDYLRGDQSREQASTGLRQRQTNLLGPVVNASPAMQSPPSAFYSDAYFPGYQKFYSDNKNRHKLLWVSANDGMLHAFDATSGAEVFAYVPGTLANRLAEIPMQRGSIGRTRVTVNGVNANFTTDTAENLPEGTIWAYVDGSPFIGDVRLGDGNTKSVQDNPIWKTYVFSSLGRGGKSFFALDATDVGTLTAAESGSNPASIFKWQFTSDDNSDLGYVVNDVRTNSDSGQPNSIVKLNNGKFAVLLNNGYKSANGKAVLFILFVDGPNSTTGVWTAGTHYVAIEADGGPDNGLSPPMWIDLDGNGTADVVYAGDLKGNMWKFDLTSSEPSNWKLAYTLDNGTKRPLFRALNGTNSNSTPLAITSAPEYAYPAFDGQIINFATGNAFDSSNFPNTNLTQRIYGIWDRPAFATGVRSLPPTDRSTLVQRTGQRLSDGSVVLTGNTNAVDWSNNDGWYLNFPGSSEMNLDSPALANGQLTFITVRPKTTSQNCSNEPDKGHYILDPLTGTATVNNLGTGTVNGGSALRIAVNTTAQKISIVNDRTKAPYTKKSCQAGDPGAVCTNGSCVCAQSPDSQCKRASGVLICINANPRVQWREIPGLRTK